MKLRLIRHATLQLELAGSVLLIDPLLAKQCAYRSLTVGPTAARNPTVPLPCSLESLLYPDIIIATHSHFDHFDQVAGARLPKQTPLICQPADERRFKRHGFKKVTPVGSNAITMGGLQFFRTGGRHGNGIIGRAMGQVSGFAIIAGQEPRLYIAGDTRWDKKVEDALSRYCPEIIVLNTGAARFNFGSPITMTANDVVEVCKAAPQAKVLVVHMEAINHCRLKRQELAVYVEKAGLSQQVKILKDGELHVT